MAVVQSPDPDTARRDSRAGVVSVLVPPLAWLASLGLSYLIQDFGCTAYASAGAAAPETLIGTIITVVNVILLVTIVLSGVLAWRLLRRADATNLVRFLGLVGVGLALSYGLGTVMIGLPPFVLEVCG